MRSALGFQEVRFDTEVLLNKATP